MQQRDRERDQLMQQLERMTAENSRRTAERDRLLQEETDRIRAYSHLADTLGPAEEAHHVEIVPD